MFCHASREVHGVRWWWHFGGQSRAVIGVEAYWWSPRFALRVGSDDDGWNLSICVPPFALYLSLDGLPLWQPRRKSIATWDNNREFWLVDRRECEVSISEWTLRFMPWGRWGEWCSADPWWIRGVSFDPRRTLLGPWQGEHENVAVTNVLIPMPEGVYQGVATTQRWTRGYTRWFKRRTTEVWLDIPKGIPHAGKGENSWDCGDDGLFGIGGATVDDAIRRAQKAVTESRRRHGHASDEAVREALGAAT